MQMPENTNQDNSEYGHFMQWRVWFLFNKSIKDQDEKNIARGTFMDVRPALKLFWFTWFLVERGSNLTSAVTLDCIFLQENKAFTNSFVSSKLLLVKLK